MDEVEESVSKVTDIDLSVAVQFEDIVSQMMDQIHNKTQLMGNFFHRFIALHNDQNETIGLQRFKNRIDGMQSLLVKSFGQSTSKMGIDNRQADTSVELF